VLLPLVTGLLIAISFAFPSARNFIVHILALVLGNHPIAVSVVGLGAPYFAAAIREFFAWLKRRRRPPIGEDGLAQGVYQTIRNMPFPAANRIYAVMGHTHDQDIQSLPEINGTKVLYLNTGSWIPVWP